MFVPTNNYFQAYIKTRCYVLDHQYDTCDGQDEGDQASCYTNVWSVEFLPMNPPSKDITFSTITSMYSTSGEALQKLRDYPDNTNQTCYHHDVRLTNVQWDSPPSSLPYLLMIIIGFSLVAFYLLVILMCCAYQHRRGEFELI